GSGNALQATDPETRALVDAIASLPVSRGPAPKIRKGKPKSASLVWWNDRRVQTGGGAAAGLIVLAASVISLQTKHGTLTIEVDQPDALVQVLDAEGKVEVSQKGDSGTVTISVDPGKHRLKVEKDGFSVFGQEFEMEKNGKKTITAKLVPVPDVTPA